MANLASAGTPAPIVEKLNREIKRLLALPNVTEIIRMLGAQPTLITTVEFGTVIHSDSRRYATIVKVLKITE